MIVVDVDLLLYAENAAAPHHERARTWLERELRSTEMTGFSHPTVVSFVRLVTSTRLMMQPKTVSDACDIVESWLHLPNVCLLAPTERHWETFRSLAIGSRASGNLAPDADLAATAIEHGATLCTHDRDFSRFEGLRVNYPLAEP